MKSNIRKTLLWILTAVIAIVPPLSLAEGLRVYTSNELKLEVLTKDSEIDIDRNAELSLSLVGDKAYAGAGETVRYTVRLENTGTDDSDVVTVTAYVPEGLTLTGAGQGGALDENTVTWDKTIAAAETMLLTFDVVVEKGASGVLSVTATAEDLAAQTDLTVSASELRLVLRAAREVVSQNETVKMSLEAVNIGDADGAWTVSVDAPAGVYQHDFSRTVSPAAGDSCSWNVALEAGESKVLRFYADIPYDASGLLEFMAMDEDDPDVADYVALTVGEAAISVRKTVDEEAPFAGDLLTYTIRVKNESEFDAGSLTVVDTLPKGVHLNKIGNSGLKSGSGKVEWNISLDAGETKILKLSAFVDDEAAIGTVLRNIARVYDSDGALLSAASALSVVDGLPEAILTIHKTVSNRTPEPGDWVRYTITVKNVGDADAEDVKIIDTLPWQLEISEDSINRGGDYYWEDDRIIWLIDVDAGETVKLTFRARIPEDAEDGDYYRNHAKIQGGDSSRVTCYVTDGVVPKTGDPLDG